MSDTAAYARYAQALDDREKLVFTRSGMRSPANARRALDAVERLEA